MLGRADYYKKGDYNALCMQCGFKFKASELRKQWNNLYVCKDCFEERHPQELIKIRPEKNRVKWTSLEPEIVYKTVEESDTTVL